MKKILSKWIFGLLRWMDIKNEGTAYFEDFKKQVSNLAGKRHWQIEVIQSAHEGPYLRAYIAGPGFEQGKTIEEVIDKLSNNKNQINPIKEVII